MRHLRLATLLLGAACVANAAPIKLFTDPTLIEFLLEGADLQGVNLPKTTGMTITGTAAGVGDLTFTSDEELESASGAASIEATDGGFDFMEFSNPLSGLSIVYFSLYPDSGTPFNGTLTVTYVPAAAGQTFEQSFTIGNGRNEFLLYSSDIDTSITKVSITADALLKSLKQVSIGNAGPPPNDAALPEPSTYAMLGGGLAALYVRARRRA